MRGFSFYLVAFAAIASIAFSSTLNTSSYSSSQANQIIANITNYVNLVNSSGYFIFSPNLTLSYQYLNKANSVYNASPNAAVGYANLAGTLAQKQYGVIQSYKDESLYIVLAVAILSLIILYVLMKPVNIRKRKFS